jgi:hydrogenase maturation protease
VKAARSLIVGLGNPILTDDAVGPTVARLVHEQLNDPAFDLCEACVGGIDLVELLVGYDRAVIIDAITTRDGRVGDCYRVDLDQTHPSRRTGLFHEIGLVEGLEFGRRVGMKLPDTLHVYAVEVLDALTFGSEMTPQVLRAIPSVVEQILGEEFAIPAS